MHCRAVAEPNRFPDTLRIILYFLQVNIEAGSVTAAQSRDRTGWTQGWNGFATPALKCTTTDTAKCYSFHAHYLHFCDITCLESCHQLAHTLRHCVPRLGTQMTAELRKLPACTPGLLVGSE